MAISSDDIFFFKVASFSPELATFSSEVATFELEVASFASILASFSSSGDKTCDKFGTSPPFLPPTLPPDASGEEIVFDPDEEHTDMLKAFVDKNISNQEFLKMLKKCDDEKSVRKLRRSLL